MLKEESVFCPKFGRARPVKDGIRYTRLGEKQGTIGAIVVINFLEARLLRLK